MGTSASLNSSSQAGRSWTRWSASAATCCRSSEKKKLPHEGGKIVTTEAQPIAPRAFNREMYHDHPENVFYGTDDGAQDGSFSEFAQIKAHYESVAPERRENIHMISVVGGLYGLNLIPLWKPTRLTIFDINPTAVTYFKLIHHVFTTSRDVAHFLQRLTDGDYDAQTEREQFVRENIRLKQRGALPRERGSTKRPYEQSWQYAFEHFELTKKIGRASCRERV